MNLTTTIIAEKFPHLLNLPDPVANGIERTSVGYVVNEQNALFQTSFK
jgi:hypothetical protein